MPVISSQYEDQGESTSESEEEENEIRVSENGGKEQSSSKAPSKKSVTHDREDSKMKVDGEGSDSDDGLTPEERLKKEQIDKEFERDIKLMEGLFQDEDAKTKRLLA